MHESLTDERKDQLRTLLSNLAVEMKDLELLNQALCHTSYANENDLPAWAANERLEFLGDAVLDLVISELLHEEFPEAREGRLSRARASAVNEHRLAATAAKLDLGSYVLLGRGEQMHGGKRKSGILADCFEALVAAIYLDGGLQATRDFLIPLFGNTALEAIDRLGSKDYKTRLQELVQAADRSVPSYRVEATKGPDHAKIFYVVLRIAEIDVAQGQGSSKKEAEQDAAHQALEKWQTPEGPDLEFPAQQTSEDAKA